MADGRIFTGNQALETGLVVAQWTGGQGDPQVVELGQDCAAARALTHLADNEAAWAARVDRPLRFLLGP